MNDALFSITYQELLQPEAETCYRYDETSCKCSESPQNRRSSAMAQDQKMATTFLGDRFYLAFKVNRNLRAEYRFRVCLSKIRKDYSKQVVDCFDHGSLVFFGNEKHDKGNQRALNLYDITDMLIKSNVGLDSKITIEFESFKDYAGKNLPRQDLDLAPINVLKSRDGTYIYRIFWGTDYSKYGTLQVAAGTGLQFYGPSGFRIVALREFHNSRAFYRCDKRHARSAHHNRVTLAQGVHYYFNPLETCSKYQKIAVEVI